MTSVLESEIERAIAPSLEAMGYAVVRVKLMGSRRPTLQIMAERRDGVAMHVDDCADISRAVSALLDVADPIGGAYTLEVSSPGIDRPLTHAADFERFAGDPVVVDAGRPIDGRRRFKGILLGLADEAVRLAVGDDEVVIPLSEIKAARLAPNDVVAAASEKRKSA